MAVLVKRGEPRRTIGDAPAVSDSEPAAPEPRGLLCELVIPTPNATWTKLQRGVGGAAGMLPTTLPGVLAALADLDAELVGELDGTSPMFGVVAGDVQAPSAVVAVKLRDVRRIRSVLAEGATSRFALRSEGALTLLVPRGGAHGTELAITANGYVVVARSVSELAELAPYVTRTLPARPLPVSAAVLDIPGIALATALVPLATAAWSEWKARLLREDARMRAERGRAADFGDPAAIVALADGLVARKLAVLEGIDRIHVVADVADDAVSVTATLPTRAGTAARTWADTMRVGDLAPVLELPRTAVLALVTRDAEPEREAQGRSVEEGLRTALRLEDEAKLHEATAAITKARDEVASLALVVDEPTGALVRAPVRDEEAAQKAVRSLVGLLQARPFKELLHIRDVTTTSEDVPGLGKMSTATILRAPSPSRRDAGVPAPALGIAWVVEGGSLLLGTGAEPGVAVRTANAQKMGKEPALGAFARAVGNDVSTTLVLQPLRLDPKRAGLPIAPLAIGLGKKGSEVFVRLDIADALFREAVRSQMGF